MAPRQMCDTCRAIPFESLPSIEEDGIPHLPSFDALEASADHCPLCSLIHFAVGASFVNVGGMVTFGPPKKSATGEKYSVEWTGSLYNKMGMRAMENGAAMLDFSPAKANLQSPRFVNPREFIPDGQSVRPWLYGNWYKSAFKGKDPELIGLGVRIGKGPQMYDAVGLTKIRGGDNSIRFPGTFLRIRADEEARLSSNIPGRLRAAYQGSELAYARIKDWIKVCEDYHPCARGHSCSTDTKSPVLPTRVLDVGELGEEYVYLTETRGLRGHYLALSHCWGTSPRLTTLRNNIGRHRDGIHLSDLAATFRDAVEIARELDIQYIWIDSLCIIQDDFADWEREAARMGDVYSNAYLTISALGSSDDDEGIFSDFNRREERPLVSSDTISTGRRCFEWAAPLIEVNTTDDEIPDRLYRPKCFFGVCTVDSTIPSRTACVYVTPEWMPDSSKPSDADANKDAVVSNRDSKIYLVGEFGGKVDSFAEEPISRRGWTLQERILSRRTLHFGSDELIWECQYCVFAEDGALLPRMIPTRAEVLDSRRVGDDSELPQTSRTSHRDPWYRLVEEYSARSLTRPDDKLPGLAGLAASIGIRSGDSYHAGLWRRDILDGLSWSVEINEPTHQCDDPAHDAALDPPSKAFKAYPESYRAPSWSWASLDGTVEFKSANSKKEDNSIAECLDIHIEPAGNNIYGMVKSGWLMLKAPISIVREAPKDESARGHRHEHMSPFTRRVEIFCRTRGKRGGTASFDDAIKLPCFAVELTKDTSLLLEARIDDRGNPVLHRSQHNNPVSSPVPTFIRIGLFSGSYGGWNKDDGQKQIAPIPATKVEKPVLGVRESRSEGNAAQQKKRVSLGNKFKGLFLDKKRDRNGVEDNKEAPGIQTSRSEPATQVFKLQDLHEMADGEKKVSAIY